MRAVVEAARKRGLRVDAHVHGDAGIRAAVRAGVSTIEHGTFASDETLRLMRDRGTCFVPTLGTWRAEPSPDSVLRKRTEIMGPLAFDAVRRANAAGVAVIAGRDMAYAPGAPPLLPELRALADAGLTADEVLRAVTAESAKCLGLAERIGSVTPGREADLIVIDGDPRLDLTRLERPRLVFVAGRLVVQR